MPDKGSLAQDMEDYNAGRAGLPVGTIAGGLGYRDYQDAQNRSSGGSGGINRGNDGAWLDKLPARYVPPKETYTAKSSWTFGELLIAISLLGVLGVPGLGATVFLIQRLSPIWQPEHWILVGLGAAVSAGIGFWLFGTESGETTRRMIVKAVAYTLLAVVLAVCAYCLYIAIPLFYQEFLVKGLNR